MEPATSSSSRDATAHRKHPQLAGLLLAVVATALTILTLEIGFRLAHFDFEFKAHAFNRLPIFYRRPIVPVGPAFFRRPGPDHWRGQVLATWYRVNGGTDDAYRDEPVREITYDSLGFRNPPDMRDWEIAVAGDSFTELGYLPYEDLFTTRLAALLDRRVKNLGVSYTSTFTQTYYLKAYGKGASTRDAVVVFFEGNDGPEMVIEHARLVAAGLPGTVPPAHATSRLESLPRQSSLLTAVYRLVTGQRPHVPETLSPAAGGPSANAYYVSGNTNIAVQLDYAPNARHLTPEGRSIIIEAFRGWGDTARGYGLRPWLAYMPCKQRVLDGYLTSTDGTPVPPLESDVPDLIRTIARETDLRFVDLTPALRNETAAGRLTFNAVADSHLNRLGSWTVAGTLADALGPVIRNDGRS